MENEKKSTKKRLFLKINEKPRPSIVSLSKITDSHLEAWKSLPEEIKNDPDLAPFKRKHAETNRETDQLDSPDPLEDDIRKQEEIMAFIGTKSTSVTKIDGEALPKKLTTIKKVKIAMGYVKIIALLACWFAFTIFLMSTNEEESEFRLLSIAEGDIKTFTLHEPPLKHHIEFTFKGAFLEEHLDAHATEYMYFYLSLDARCGPGSWNGSEMFKLPLINQSHIDIADEIERKTTINLSHDDFESLQRNDSKLKINLMTNLSTNFPVKVTYDPSPIDESTGVILAAFILLGLYILIIWELVPRTFAAMVASTTAVGVLAAMNEKPSMARIVSWIDVETLLLLFGMMILVAILSETGVFDYLAVYAFKITNGKIWPLIICLCIFTAVLSSVLDNVTTILLMTPVTIRLCEVMELNPVPVLMFAVIFSNIGGTMTPVGDPPNVIIASNSYISSNGINFTNFTLHMAICVVLVMIQSYYQIRYMYKDINSLRFTEPKAIQELRHEITIWQRAAASLSSYSQEEEVVRRSLERKIVRLTRLLEMRLESDEVPEESYQATLGELQAKYPIKNMKLLYKSCFTLVFVVTFFFLHSLPDIQKLSLGWTALLGAILLLILYDREDLEAILAHVEWSTLLFFAALFVLMEALTELGLIEWIGQQTESVIMSVGESSRLGVAMLIILWVSAIASAFVDNIPLTTMMVKIVISLAENEALNLPLQPLVWSLALGACLGGNGTLIGASANVVCAGVAEQHGYKFTFVQFFKVGFPVMIGSIIVATVYLMIAHVLFAWH